MLSKLKIFLLSATGFERKCEMSQADATGQTSNIPEPALDWEGKAQEEEELPGLGKTIGYRTGSFLSTMKTKVLKIPFETISFFPM